MAEFELENTFWDATVTAWRSAYLNGKLWVGGCDAQGKIRLDVIAPDGTTQRIDVGPLTITPTGGDDHNSPSVVVVPGQVPFVSYTTHNIDSTMRYRRGSVNSDEDFIGTLITGQTLGWISVATTITHTHVQVVDDDLHVWTRINDGSSNRYYGYARSQDWGATWNITPVKVFDSGVGNFTYPNFALAPDGETARMFVATETADLVNNFICYGEINLTTGDIYNGPGGSVIANIQAPSGLMVTWRTALTKMRTAPAGIHRSMRDVGANADPEVAWIEFDDADPQGTSMVWYGIWDGAAWQNNPVCTCGRQFGQGALGGYHGGVSFTNEAPGKLLISRRADDGTWTIERWSTPDEGVTWSQDAVIAEEAETNGIVALARPYQIGGSAGTYKAIYGRIERYGNDWEDMQGYRDWKASLIVTDQ